MTAVQQILDCQERFDSQFATHAQAHRAAARAYVHTDTDGADTIDDADPSS